MDTFQHVSSSTVYGMGWEEGVICVLWCDIYKCDWQAANIIENVIYYFASVVFDRICYFSVGLFLWIRIRFCYVNE